MKAGLIVAVAAAGLIVAAPAQAAKGTYAGTVTNTTGKIALDVKIDRAGVVTKVIRLRGNAIPSTCEISGPIPDVDFDLASSLTVRSNGRFSGTYTQPTYGNESTISGRIKHKHVAGSLRFNYHYPADPQHGYPEENCDTGPLAYAAKLGAPDGTQTARPNWR